MEGSTVTLVSEDSAALAAIAQAVHDMRNQVAVVAGAAAFLKRSWDALDDAIRREQVDVIAQYADKLRQLTADVLDWTSISTGRVPVVIEPVDIAEIASAAVNETGLASSVDIDVPHATVLADRRHLARVLANLLGNAAKHGRPPVRLRASTVQSEVVVRVEDQGEGVPDDIVESVFDPFVRYGEAGEHGAGLGLAIVRGLVEVQGGRVWYERRAGVSSFAVALPASG